MKINMRLRPVYVATIPLAELVFMTGSSSDYRTLETQNCELVHFMVPNASPSDLIQRSLPVPPVVGGSRIDHSPSTDQHESQWHHIDGRVAGIDAAGKRFVLRIRGSSVQVFVVSTDSATRFDDFDKDGLANAFSSIAVGQVLAVEMEPRNGRPLIAKEVRYLNTRKKGN